MAKAKKTDAEQVADYMDQLQHPLKDEINAVRQIILQSNSKLSERIKWNAPSYYYLEDIVTFNARPTNHVHLVFHHPSIVTINSPSLEGNYKDRRMMYLKNMQEVRERKAELESIMNQLVEIIDGKS